MRNKVVVFLCFIVILFFFMYKPLYSVLLFTIFSYEHFLFINYVTSYWIAKRSDSYACFRITPIKTNEINTYGLWLKINEIYAFKRLYTMIMVKKITFRSILFAIIVIFFGFPVKVFKISNFLIWHNENLNESLVYFYFINYQTIKDKQIEVCFKKTYLNGSTRADIIIKIIKLNPTKSKEDIAGIYESLVKCNYAFMNANANFDNTMAPFKLGFLKTEEGVKIAIPHWTNVSYWKVNGDKVLSATHATSNVPKTLSDTQFKSVAMKDLLKPGNTRSGSIITGGDYIFKPIKDEQIFIKSWQLDYVMYNIYKKDLKSQYINEFLDRDAKIISILGPNASNDDISEFSSCHHDIIFENDRNKTFKEFLDEVNDLIK